jgi:hypothetical protein
MPLYLEILITIIGFVAPAWADRRRLRLTTHRAFFLNRDGQPTGPEHYFITATNRSRSRDLTITHMWLATDPNVDIIDESLPVRLRPDERWETFVEVERLPIATREVAFSLARAQLSTDTVVSSTRNWNVRPVGTVPRRPR